MTTESEPKTDAKPVPTGVQLTALDETFAANPYPVMAEVREREPVHYDAVIKRWILTRFDDVDAVLRDRTMAVDGRKGGARHLHGDVRSSATASRACSCRTTRRTHGCAAS